ncbi:hypothetical protein V8C42DRAFT_336025 [Trichoderma barbatum]
MSGRRSARFPRFRLRSETTSALTAAQQPYYRYIPPHALQTLISLFSPPLPYAEDRPLAFLARAVSVGSIGGSLIASMRHFVPALRLHRPLPVNILLGASTGTVCSVAFTSLVLVAGIRGREDVELQDHAWRPENEGQLEADNWRYGGMAAAAGTALAIGNIRALGWRAFVGAAGLGSVSGTVGYLAWTYGSGLH